MYLLVDTMTKERGMAIGGAISESLYVDVNVRAKGDHLRIRVNIDITKSLRRGMMLQLH